MQSNWKTPSKEEPRSIFDDLNETAQPYRTVPKIIKTDSRHSMIVPHTVAVFGYDPEEENNIEEMLKSVGNVVDVKREERCIFLTYSTHLGAEKALEYHKTIVGNTRIAVELQKADNQVVEDPLQKKSWLSWIGLN